MDLGESSKGGLLEVRSIARGGDDIFDRASDLPEVNEFELLAHQLGILESAVGAAERFAFHRQRQGSSLGRSKRDHLVVDEARISELILLGKVVRLVGVDDASVWLPHKVRIVFFNQTPQNIF